MDPRPLVFALGLLVAAGLPAAEVYRWTDDDGVVHYSDQPHPGAEKIYLAEPNSSRALSSARKRTDGTEPTASPDFVKYESLAVTAPVAEETLWNIEAVLNVTVSVNPALQPGHQLRVYFDGTPQMVAGTSFQLQEVWRGSHNLQAEIIDGTGKLMIRSKPIRFYVQQSTVR